MIILILDIRASFSNFKVQRKSDLEKYRKKLTSVSLWYDGWKYKFNCLLKELNFHILQKRMVNQTQAINFLNSLALHVDLIWQYLSVRTYATISLKLPAKRIELSHSRFYTRMVNKTQAKSYAYMFHQSSGLCTDYFSVLVP